MGDFKLPPKKPASPFAGWRGHHVGVRVKDLRVTLGPQPMFATRPLHSAEADMTASPRDVAEAP